MDQFRLWFWNLIPEQYLTEKDKNCGIWSKPFWILFLFDKLSACIKAAWHWWKVTFCRATTNKCDTTGESRQKYKSNATVYDFCHCCPFLRNTLLGDGQKKYELSWWEVNDRWGCSHSGASLQCGQTRLDKGSVFVSQTPSLGITSEQRNLLFQPAVSLTLPPHTVNCTYDSFPLPMKDSNLICSFFLDSFYSELSCSFADCHIQNG